MLIRHAGRRRVQGGAVSIGRAGRGRTECRHWSEGGRTVGCAQGAPALCVVQCDYAFCLCVPGRPRHAKRLGHSKDSARALRTGCLESSPRGVLNVPRWAPKGALYPTRCHRTLLASDLFALSESTGRAQVSTPQPRTQRVRALPRSESSQFVAPTPPAPFLLPILPGAGPYALVLAPLPLRAGATRAAGDKRTGAGPTVGRAGVRERAVRGRLCHRRHDLAVGHPRGRARARSDPADQGRCNL